MWYSVEIHNTPTTSAKPLPPFKDFLSACSIRLRKALCPSWHMSDGYGSFDSWERLATVTEAVLRARKNCGDTTIKELRERLAIYGLSLRTTPWLTVNAS
jgi:hypothetical protein